jgi:hypothetical protein
MKAKSILIYLIIAAFSVITLGFFGFLPMTHGSVHFCLASFALNGKCPITNNLITLGDFHISGFKVLSTASILGLALVLLGVVGTIILISWLPGLLMPQTSANLGEFIPLTREQFRHWFSLHQKRDPRIN